MLPQTAPCCSPVARSARRPGPSFPVESARQADAQRSPATQRSNDRCAHQRQQLERRSEEHTSELQSPCNDRKSTRLNSSHLVISYAVFCLKKKKTKTC